MSSENYTAVISRSAKVFWNVSTPHWFLELSQINMKVKLKWLMIKIPSLNSSIWCVDDEVGEQRPCYLNAMILRIREANLAQEHSSYKVTTANTGSGVLRCFIAMQFFAANLRTFLAYNLQTKKCAGVQKMTNTRYAHEERCGPNESKEWTWQGNK